MPPIIEDFVAQGAISVDRRAEIRQRVNKMGRPTFNNGRCALQCAVRDLSSHGARLRFGDVVAVPPRFDLEIAGEAVARRARVRWRTLTEMGVLLD